LQKILTAAQMREIDRLTTEECGVPGLILMENAASRVYEFLEENFPPLASQKVVVLCGKGNNGGDGLAVARLLRVRAQVPDVRVILTGGPDQLHGDAAANYRMLRGAGVEAALAADAEAWRALRGELLGVTLIIDALLGTGLKGPARGHYCDIIADINENFSHAGIVSVDIPSGMPSDSGEPWGEAVNADATVTFTAPKMAHVFPPNCHLAGDLRVAPIGTPPALLLENPELKLALMEAADVRPFLAPRAPESHKGDYGHVLAVAGSRSKPGAALMTGTSALRSGAGLVTVATAASAVVPLITHTPELMTQPAEESEDGSMTAESFRPEWLEGKSVAAAGPGLGTAPLQQALMERLLREVEVPLVVDADGLTLMAALGPEKWKTRSPALVLTPHPGEMSRLSGCSTKEIQRDRARIAGEFAERHSLYLVLKGYRTVIATPGGEVFVNPTGSPGMATGGSGDILTGMIAGFLAQFPDAPPEKVVAAAVYLHGLAGEIAAGELGERTMLATDLLDTLPAAIESVQ